MVCNERIHDLKNYISYTILAFAGTILHNERIGQMREDVEAYEEAVRRKATLTEQARLKEQAARELDSKAKSIKDKFIINEAKK